MVSSYSTLEPGHCTLLWTDTHNNQESVLQLRRILYLSSVDDRAGQGCIPLHIGYTNSGSCKDPLVFRLFRPLSRPFFTLYDVVHFLDHFLGHSLDPSGTGWTVKFRLQKALRRRPAGVIRHVSRLQLAPDSITHGLLPV